MKGQKKQDWRDFLTPDERRQVDEIDRRICALEVEKAPLAWERQKIANRCAQRRRFEEQRAAVNGQ